MSAMKELLGQGDVPKPRRNFLQENVRKLKELKLEKPSKTHSQRNPCVKPLTERRNTQTATNGGGLSNQSGLRVASRLLRSPPRHGRAQRAGGQPDRPRPTVTTDDTPKGYRSQGCQTLNSKQLESLYHDGVIRYPSAQGVPRTLDMHSDGGCSVREMGLQTEDELQLEVLHPPPEAMGLHWDEERDRAREEIGQKDFVKLNSTIPEPHMSLETSRTDPTRAPPTYQRGVVPKYLREHKKEVERERLTKAQEAADECPEGHILLPEDIRTKHLTNLKEKYSLLVSQLNKLPVSTDTLRTRMRKKEIETDLDRIEAAMALFSREKVFVKADL